MNKQGETDRLTKTLQGMEGVEMYELAVYLVSEGYIKLESVGLDVDGLLRVLDEVFNIQIKVSSEEEWESKRQAIANNIKSILVVKGE